ncbi:hypothetical protein GNI_094720 [Gregarina niphandrodes]|uniref:Uncharacterized protein n=1 Tax=Gregarina niphandrodes TaxID=110365 RepID=A0A023B528_GRENI|nr:hypothetical protein GNI_094720 [Gregarina niphandrodes]EZG58461.1 hypothetical protein GNI_094720 [Gregarina niphandrodes]|eukprot:XP_011130960.1 hypothetical protein GNI_094720 [Gregarina niphandrodes]
MTAIFIQVKNRREGLAEGPLLEAMVEQVRLEPATVSADGCHFWLLQRTRQRTRRPLSVNCASFTFESLFERFQQSVVALLTSLLNDTVRLMTSVDHGRKPEEQLRVEKTFYEMITKLPDYVPAHPLGLSGRDCESGGAKRARMINDCAE